MRPTAASVPRSGSPIPVHQDIVADRPDGEWYEVDTCGDLGSAYGAATELIRQLVETGSAASRDLLAAHQLTLLLIWPGAARHISVSGEVNEWLAISREGNARSWTLRLAHGITDFLLDYAGLLYGTSRRRLGIYFKNIEQADSLDREFISVLRRRADPERLILRVGGSSDPAQERPIRESGPMDIEALLTASKRCMRLAYYQAALDNARRGLDIGLAAVDDSRDNELTRHVLFALLLLGRFEDVETLCDRCITHSSDPALLSHVTYARAILTARLYEPGRRDFDAARGWIEKSLAFTEMLPPSENRVVNLAFLRNTLALVEMRTGQLSAARALLTAGLAYIAAEAPNRYKEECVLLLHNRARLHIARKETDAAIEDLTELLRHQPSNSEAWLDRGLLYQRAGAYDEALKDYNDAIRWSPPYPEPHFNRAQVLVALGRPGEALRDYDRVLQLTADHREALTNRACLLYDLGEFDASERDVERGLNSVPGHAKLLCLRGLLYLKAGDDVRAYDSFTESIEADVSLADAWANRAVISFKRKDAKAALLDLTRALELRRDPDVLYNRGRVFESQRKWAGAAEDYGEALRLAKGNGHDISKRLNLCREKMVTPLPEAETEARRE